MQNLPPYHVLHGCISAAQHEQMCICMPCCAEHACCVQPIQFMLSSTTGSLAVVAVAILRIYLGWAYVGNRLLSAAVDYEESGWCVLTASHGQGCRHVTAMPSNATILLPLQVPGS